MIAVVIPAYNEADHVAGVIAGIPDIVDLIVLVDDGSTDETSNMALHSGDSRLQVLRHEQNLGVGAAMISGYNLALEKGAEIIVKMDGDGQMDPGQVTRLITPISAGLADYTKGFRFHDPENVRQMPFVRLLGNVILSFLTKIVSGYWNVFDPTSGFTAIHRVAMRRLNIDRLDPGYFFETDMLIQLYKTRAVVQDVHISTKYGQEVSQLKPFNILMTFPGKYIKAFCSRILISYFITDFTAVSLFLVLGIPLFLFGFLFGLYHWITNLYAHVATATGTIMIAVVSLLFGFQFLLQAVVLDINNFPRTPLQKLNVD
ncbi:glycosyltransferase family 2 protein [bacterium]|nr:glycosyltransferase family 2 protein [bacterium]